MSNMSRTYSAFGTCLMGWSSPLELFWILTGSIDETEVPAKRKHEALTLECPLCLPSSPPPSEQAWPSDTLHTTYLEAVRTAAHGYFRSFGVMVGSMALLLVRFVIDYWPNKSRVSSYLKR